MKLTQGQVDGLDEITTGNQHVVVMGKPGSGKSTLLKTHRASWGSETIYCGTTGVANQQLFDNEGGSGTFHRVMSLPTTLYNNEHEKKMSRYTTDLFMQSDAVNTVICDEFFMTNPDSLELVSKRLEKASKPNKKRKERNIKLCGFGDPLQIPSPMSNETVAQLKQRHGSHLFFKTNLFKEMDFKVQYLSEIKRTGDAEFIGHMDTLRYGSHGQMKEALQYFNQRCVAPPDNIPLLSPYNKVVDGANYKALVNNPNPCGKYTAAVTGRFDFKDSPMEDTLRLKEGLPVITLVNHVEGIYNNGSSGVVVQLTAEGVYVRFNATGETHLVEPHKFCQYESYISGQEEAADGSMRDVVGQKEVGSAKIPPLKLAAAMTGHRAQGRTIDTSAVVDAGWGFKPEGNFGTALVYVMLSRFTRVEDIYLKQRLTEKHIKVCYETIEWMKGEGFCD